MIETKPPRMYTVGQKTYTEGEATGIQRTIYSFYGKVIENQWKYYLKAPFVPTDPSRLLYLPVLSVAKNVFGYQVALNEGTSHAFEQDDIQEAARKLHQYRDFIRWGEDELTPPDTVTVTDFPDYLRQKLLRNNMLAINDPLLIIKSVVGNTHEIAGFDPLHDDVYEMLGNSQTLRIRFSRTSDRNNMISLGALTSLNRPLGVS